MRPSSALWFRIGRAARVFTAQALTTARPAARALPLAFALCLVVPSVAVAQMSVTPDNSPVSAPPGSSGSLTFTLQTDDPNAAQNTIQVSCDGTVVVSCGSDNSWVMIQSGSPVTITVNYTVGNNAGGTGYIDVSMTDQWTGETVDGSADVTTQSSKPSLSANPTTQYTGENVSTNYPSFTLTNSGDTPASYAATVTCSIASNCSVRAQPPSGLAPGASTTLIVDYQSYFASAGNESITLHVTSQFTESASSTVTIVPLSEAVRVTTGTALTAPRPSQSATYPFTIAATGNNTSAIGYTLTTSCTGALSCGPASPTSVSITPGSPASASVVATATSNLAGGSGTVALTASYTDGWGHPYTSTNSFNVLVPDIRSYTVAVSPTSTTSYNEANISTNYGFTLTNSGNTQAAYTLTLPTCSGTASGCSFSSTGAVTSTTVTVSGNNGTALVPVYFTTLGAGQNASITLQAAGPSNTALGSVTLVPVSDTVTVVATSGMPAVLTNGSGTYNFTVTNVGNNDNVTYTLQVTGCTTPVVSCSVTGGGTTTTLTLNHGHAAIVPVTFQSQSTAGTGQITLRAFIQQVHLYQASATGSVVVNPRLAVSTAFMNNTDQDMGLCAASCFAVTAARSTVPYYSLNQPRSITLAYNSDRAFPRPFVYADVSVTSAPASVSEYRLEVQRNGADLTFTNGETVLHFQGTSTPAGSYRLAGQLDLTSDSTGMYAVTIIATAVYANGTMDQTAVPTQLMVVNTGISPVAKGWTVAGVPRLYMQSDSSALITDGAGSAKYFAKSSSTYSGYVTPAGDYSTLWPRSSHAGWKQTFGDNSTIWFSSAGLADSVTDRFGISTRFVYDGSQRLVQVYDSTLVRSVGAARAVTTLNYGSTGLSSIVEPNPVASSGRATAIHVDASGMLRAVVDPDSDSTSYGYDGSSRLSSARDRNGTTMTFRYDATWKADSIIAPAVPTDIGGGDTTSQTPITRLAAWQSVGVPTSATATNHAPLLSTDTLVARSIDPLGYITKYSPDQWGQPLKITDPLGNSTVITRGAGALATHIVYPDSSTDDYHYTVYPLPDWSLHSGQDTVFYGYGAADQITTISGTGVVGETHTLEGGTGRIITLQYGSNAADTTHYTYDLVTKQVASVLTPDGATTSYQYDPVFGNLATTTAPGNRVTSVVYDAYGRDSTVKAPQTPMQTTLYDIVNHPTDLNNGVSGVPVHIGYTGDLAVSVRDQHHQVDSTEYDALGRATRHFGFTSSTLATTTRYDLDSRPTSTSNRRGQRIDVTYDSLGRVLTKSGDNTTADQFVYSKTGRVDTVTVMSAGDTVRVISAPAASKDTVQTTIGSHTYTVAHTLTNLAGGTDRTTISSDVPGMGFLTRSFVHDAVTGGLAGITLGTTPTTFGYNNAAQRTATVWAGMVPGSASYLTTSGYARQVYGVMGSALDNAFDVQYAADSASRILRDHRRNAAGTADVNRIFDYDALGQFTGVTDASAVAWNCGGSGRFDPNYGDVGCPIDTVTTIQSYTYDLVGNRSTTFFSGTQYVGDRLQQLPDVVHGSGTYYQYTYDDDGNVLTKTKTATGEMWTYTWSAEDNLTRVTHSVSGVNDPAVAYIYDAFGQPVKKTRGGTLERLSLYDGGQLMADLAADGTRLAEYVYDAGTDTPHAVLTGADTVTNTQYVAQDALGNVTGTFTADSSAQQRVTYDDWGAPAVTGTSANRLFWKGLAYDTDAGLYYVRARWYDPDAGRFASEDPAGLEGGINPYLFAGNDPIDGADPTGLSAMALPSGDDWPYTIQTLLDYLGIPTNPDGGDPLPHNPTGGTAQSKPKPKACPVSAKALDTYLQNNHSPMVGEGDHLMSTGQEFDLDPRLFIAISAAETEFGRNVKCGVPYNAFGLLYNGCQGSTFASYQRAIYSLGKSLRNPNNQYDLTNTTTMYQHYCVSKCHRAPLDQSLLKQGGKLDALAYPCKKEE